MINMDISPVKEHLHSHGDIIAAYIFGSTSSGSRTSESDIDIAIPTKHLKDFREFAGHFSIYLEKEENN